MQAYALCTGVWKIVPDNSQQQQEELEETAVRIHQEVSIQAVAASGARRLGHNIHELDAVHRHRHQWWHQ